MLFRSLCSSCYAVVLAGGRGSRLGPLTDRRAKPAVPFAGQLKIIDFPLSNCVNSGIRRIGVLTQYKAQSLIRHVERGWGFLQSSLGEFIDIDSKVVVELDSAMGPINAALGYLS